MKMLIEEFPDGCDGDKKNNFREKKTHRVITEKKKENNQYTLGKVIEGFPDNTSPVEMQEDVNNEDYDEK